MAKNTNLYEIWVRKGEQGGPFNPKDPSILNSAAEVYACAKKLVDDGTVDEAVVLEKRIIQRFSKYAGEG